MITSHLRIASFMPLLTCVYRYGKECYITNSAEIFLTPMSSETKLSSFIFEINIHELNIFCNLTDTIMNYSKLLPTAKLLNA